ncbi:unnamed protein product [Linum perenne]
MGRDGYEGGCGGRSWGWLHRWQMEAAGMATTGTDWRRSIEDVGRWVATGRGGAAGLRRDRGGAPVNVAIAVSRLGGKTAFVGKLGDDIYFRNPSADMLLQPEEFNLDLIRSTPLHRVRHQRPDSVTSGQIPSPSA